MMRRSLGLTLVLFTLLCAEGCRRLPASKKQPIAVLKESDFTFAKTPDDELRTKLKPLPPEPKDAPAVDPKLAEAVQKAKELKEQQKRLTDTMQLGQEFEKFCNMHPSVKDQSIDKFSTYLRRRRLYDLREQVDTGGMEVFFLSLPAPSGHIVAMHKTANDKDYPIYVIGSNTTGTFNTEALPAKIDAQELVVAWKHFVDYALPHYYYTPSDPGELALFRRIHNPLAPATTLASLAANLPKSLKNPPEARDVSKFTRYLKDNARPDLLKAIETKKILININADLRLGTDLVAAQGTETRDKGFPTINCNGLTGYSPANVIDARFKQPQP